MSRIDLPAEITLTFHEARVIYLALYEAADAAGEGSELRIRLYASRRIIARKLAPDLGDLP